jgi:carbonic anhydrase
MAASVRKRWPRTSRHPVVAMVTCMDARLDTNEIAGDTRRYYYVLRLAGSVISVVEQEMLELAVSNGVKVVVFTTHTDCAAEKVARDSVMRASFPNLSKGIDEREAKFREFLGRPLIKTKTGTNELLVKWMDLDTANEQVMPHEL